MVVGWRCNVAQIESTRVDYVVCTGNFGFYDADSPSSDPLPEGEGDSEGKSTKHLPAWRGELELLLRGQLQLKVPVYTVWGDTEDVRVVCKFRTGEYAIKNLHILDEEHTVSATFDAACVRSFVGVCVQCNAS
jgi:hypothetical protein